LYLSVTSLQQQIEKLPFLVVPAQTAEVPSAATTSSSSLWARGLDRIARVLRQMVVVYRLPTPNTPPFITPDRRPYSYENLQAVLGDAGWAVLHHDNQVYQSNIQQASNWVRQYFSLNSPLTKTVLNELQALQAVSVQPGKEVVLLSPKAFEDYLKAATPPASSAVSS
jgi:uroporphyrin-3 C-methyltransferase